MKPITTKSENWDYFFTLCSINMNMASISGKGNVQPVFNLEPCVFESSVVWDCWQHHKFFLVSLSNYVLMSCRPGPQQIPREKKSGGRSGDLTDHVMYGVPLPIHPAGNCSSTNVRTMLVSVMETHLAIKLFHQRVEAQHTDTTYPVTCLQWPYSLCFNSLIE